MDPEKWQRIKSLFEAALEKTPAERGKFIAQASGGDESVKAEVESLLAYKDSAHSFAGILQPYAAAVAPQPAIEAHEALGDRHIGPYQLMRELGRGGMAVVYLGMRADDQYRKRVAIKLVLPGFDSDEVLRRFRNERQTLAALDHPNIVKLLDGGSLDGGRPYLVMDYVEGVPIDGYCDAHRLSTTERLQLFLQVCSAVHYAHLNLVVHRDLKPSNVLVTNDGTPKLLDFGIAKLLNPEYARTLLVTGTNLRLMTPEYASPEQVRGEAVTAVSDVYSLGVVLYELLTGHRPYRMNRYTPLEIEKAICEREPEKPSTAVSRVEQISDLDASTVTTITPEQVSRTREEDTQKLRRRLQGDLDVIVLKALRKEPQRRYASVYEVSEDIRLHLQHLPIKARPATLAYRTGKFVRRHKEAAMATLFFLVLLSVLATWEALRAKSSSGRVGFTPRRSVAVLGFKNLSGKPESTWLSTALAEMLTTELGIDGRLRTIPGENVAKMKVDLTLPDTEALAPATLARVRENLNTDLVVLGSYLELPSGQMRLDLRLQDAQAGETVAEAAETGTEADLFDLVERTGSDLRIRMGVARLDPSQILSVKASLPATPEAARLYAQGLAKLRASDALAAVELLGKAADIEPEYPLVHRALAEAWNWLGYDQKARIEAKKAFDSSASLGSDEQRWVEAQYWKTIGEFDKAIGVYSTLSQSSPDNLDYGLQLAQAQIKGGRAKNALNTLARLRRFPPPAGTDPRIDEAEAVAADALGDFNHELAYGQKAEMKARSQGARLLTADALNSEAIARWKLGQANQALAVYQQAGEIYRDIHDQHGVATALTNSAILVSRLGNSAEAEKMYQEALEVFRAMGNRHHAGRTLSNIAIFRYNQGDLNAARTDFEESLELARQSGDKGSEASVLLNIGELLLHQGNPDRARESYSQAYSVAKEIDDEDSMAYATEGLGDIHRVTDELSAAKKEYSEALDIAKKAGDNELVADIEVGLAQLLLDQGLLSQAEQLAREAKLEFHNEHYSDGEIDATGALASCLLAEGRSGEAMKEINDGDALLHRSQRYRTQLQFAVAAARVHAVADPAKATEKLKSILVEASKYGFLTFQFEAKLALGEIEMKAGTTAAARSRLVALERAAKSKGFRLLARQAAVARNRHSS